MRLKVMRNPPNMVTETSFNLVSHGSNLILAIISCTTQVMAVATCLAGLIGWRIPGETIPPNSYGVWADPGPAIRRGGRRLHRSDHSGAELLTVLRREVLATNRGPPLRNPLRQAWDRLGFAAPFHDMQHHDAESPNQRGETGAQEDLPRRPAGDQ